MGFELNDRVLGLNVQLQAFMDTHIYPRGHDWHEWCLYLSDKEREAICEAGVRIGKQVDYSCAGTVEFLMDVKSREFFFIEVNPRVQVEHTVTEEITGIDIVKAQFLLASGAKIGDGICGVPKQQDIIMKGHAIQSRVTTEDAANDFAPDYGKITVYRSASGHGIRLDAGTAATGTVITPYYDSLLVKVSAKGQSPLEAKQRMNRALHYRPPRPLIEYLSNYPGSVPCAGGKLLLNHYLPKKSSVATDVRHRRFRCQSDSQW